MTASDESHPGSRKPSRSGADTQRSSPLVGPGGKLDARALRSAMGLGGTDPAAVPSTELPADAPLARARTVEGEDTIAPAATADDDAPNRVVFVLQRDLQKRLDKYLTDRIPFMSRTQLQRLIDEGGVLVNGRSPKSSTKLRIDDRVEVFVPPPPPTDVPPQDIPLNVLYEDQHLIVLNKQPDIIVHPARSELSGTLINALAFHFQHRSTTGGALSGVGKEFARPGVVHRLDRNTSGCIVFAKSDEAHWQLGRQFELRTVDKRYLAITHGEVTPDVDVIDLPIGPHPSREKGYREKYVVRYDYLGKPSVTIARVRGVFRRPDTDPAAAISLVELELKTGRTHQIRVHLSHGGHPIVADDMYGGRFLHPADLGLPGAPPGPAPESPILSRVALHAATLGFQHPISKEPLRFTAPFPADLRAMLDAARRMDPSAAPRTPPGATVDLSTIWT